MGNILAKGGLGGLVEEYVPDSGSTFWILIWAAITFLLNAFAFIVTAAIFYATICGRKTRRICRFLSSIQFVLYVFGIVFHVCFLRKIDNDLIQKLKPLGEKILKLLPKPKPSMSDVNSFDWSAEWPKRFVRSLVFNIALGSLQLILFLKLISLAVYYECASSD